MDTIFLFLGLGGPEIFVVLFVVLLLFGGKKIPELMRGLGKGIREFNSARDTIEGEIKQGMREADMKKLDAQRAEEDLKERLRAEIKAEQMTKGGDA